MGVGSVRQMAERVAALLDDKLGIRGTSLSEKLRGGGHMLPRRVRTAASILAEASELAMTPKLHARLDDQRVAEAYDICMDYLATVRRGAHSGAGSKAIFASIGFSLLTIIAGLIGYLVWAGHV